MRSIALVLTVVLLSGCGAAPTVRPTVTAPVAPTASPVASVAPAPPAPTATAGPTVAPAPTVARYAPLAMTADETYLVSLVQAQMGEARGLQTWYSGLSAGTLAAASVEQQAIQESAALQGQAQRLAVALQPLADPRFRCFGRIAIVGATTDTMAAADLANVAAARRTTGTTSAEWAERFSPDIAAALAVEDALHAEVLGLGDGVPLPSVASQAQVLHGAPYGGTASALGCT